MKYLKYKKGFSLVELLLYISIASILLLAISVFFSFLLRARIKNQVIAEVEQQGLSVMHLMTQTTRNAEAIILPVQSVSAPSLSLQFPSSSIDPSFCTSVPESFSNEYTRNYSDPVYAHLC